jgi:hypothetical protein
MKMAGVLGVSFVLFPLVGAAAPATSVAEAQKTLETARTNLAKAVKAIEKDPPSTVDLDAALAAVGALKDAIEAGAAQEANDLDYAQATLAARKELRTQRTWVEERRAKVVIFDAHRAIDAALATVNDGVRRLEAKDAAPKDFDDARAAIDALKKVMEPARSFGKQDAAFAKYLGDTDATVAQKEKAIDERALAQLVEKQRPQLEESRQALAAAMAAIAKGGTDAQFEEADKASSALTKQLEVGKPLEAKDKAYRADADRARGDQANAKKKMDEAWSATGLAKLKAQIEPARKDLIAAGKGVKGRKPSADQLAEARTAAIVVRKLIEKFKPEAARSQAFAQYVGEVETNLVEVEVVLEGRSLEAARADVVQALKNLDVPEPTDEVFNAARTANQALEKLLETVHKKDPALAQPWVDAKADLTQATRQFDRLWSATALTRLKSELEPARKDLVAAGKAARARKPTADQLAEAKTATIVVRKLIEKYQPEAAKSEPFANYVAGVQKTVVEVETELQRQAIVAAQTDLMQAVANLDKPEPTDALFTAARDAMTALEKSLEGVELKDATLGPAAVDAQAELRQDRKKVDSLWASTSVARLKGQIEPARKDLVAAAKAAHGRKPTADQLAEAKTATTVVRKLIEKLKPEAEKNPVFGNYLDGVTTAVGDIELDLQRQSVVVAMDQVTSAQKNLEKKDPADDLFTESTAALSILEKTIEAVPGKDPALAPTVGDAKLLLRDGRARTALRRIEVDVERQKAKVEEARKKAADAMMVIASPTLTAEQVKAAEAAIAEMKTALEAGGELTKKDRGYAAYDREIHARITELNAKIVTRKVVLSANDARSQLIDLTTTAKAALATAKQPESTDAQLAAATAAIEAINTAVEKNAPLEQQDVKYASQSNKARDDYFKLVEGFEMARQVREVRKRTVEPYAAGMAGVAAVASANLKTQKAAYDKALIQFKGCVSDGPSLIKDNVALGKAAIVLEGRPSTPTEVISLCVQQVAATDVLLKQVVPLLAFEEGPKKAFEAGKALLGQGKKTEALAQFDECIADGIILNARSPELKERKFTVAGAETTLPQVISQCTAQSKSLRGK